MSTTAKQTFDLKKFLRYLWRQGVEIWQENGELRFNAPQGALTESRSSFLQQHEKAIKELLDEKPDRYRGFPLGEGQKSIKLMQDMAEGSNAYHLYGVLFLHDDLDTIVLQQSIDQVVARHAILRSTLVEHDGEPGQRIHLDRQIVVAIEHKEGLDRAGIDSWAYRQVDKPFDLHNDLLLRFTLLDNQNPACGAARYVLVMTAHHILTDYWALEIIGREINMMYAALRSGQQAKLSSLTTSYKDYVLTEANMLVGDKGKEHAQYWQQQLSSCPPPLQLPTDFPRPLKPRYVGEQIACEFKPELSAAIRDTAKQLGVTPYVVILSAYELLLHRYTREDTIVIGTPMFCRGRPGTRHVVGLFTNPVPIIGHFENNPRFNELATNASQQVKGGTAHQEYPFQMIVDRLQPERDSSRTPIFQTALSWNQLNNASQEVGGDNLVQSIERTEQRGAIYDLAVFCYDTGNAIRINLRYNSDLFRQQTIQRLFTHFEKLLKAVIRDPNCKIGDYPFLTDAETAQFKQWNDTRTDYPDQHNVAELFERRVEDNPDALAIQYQDEQLTYQELDQRASQLAGILKEHGIGGGEYIGVCLDRSIDLIASILAITKAGAAYMPIDPDFPDDRIVFMLDDTEAPIIITTSQHQARLAAIADTGTTICCLDRVDRSHYPTQWRTVSREQHGLEPGCVLFTSGSTGRPKGVLVTHRGLARLVVNTNYYQIRPGQVIAHLSNICFDAASWEIWGALLNGASLLVVDKETLLTPERFEILLLSGRIDALLLTAALLNLYAGRNPALFNRVDGLLTGGEAADPNVFRRIRKAGGPRQLINAYGPTENATLISTRQVSDVPEGASTIPIGTPVSNSTVYILDRYGKQVPVGVTGEIFTGGDGVALGYLKRPELTDEVFLDDPYAKRANAKMYATGDLGRFLDNGDIEILGRKDDQVKLRGHRIELSEIDNAICSIDTVQHGVTIIRNDHGERYIAAYIVPTDKTLLDDTQGCKTFYQSLRQSLRQKLPGYMIPAAYLTLPDIPLTSTGKVDKRALPMPELGGDQEYVAPRNAFEEQIAMVWAQCLQLDRVGIYDNFLELGGHSLLATQTASRLQESLQQPVSMRNLFEAPTVAELADLLQSKQKSSSLPPIEPADRNEPIPLSMSQQRLWLVEQLDPGSIAYNMPAALRFKGTLNTQALNRALQRIIERHEAIRTCFSERDGAIEQHIEESRQWQLSVTDLSHLDPAAQNAEVKSKAQQLASRTFDLRCGPLFSVELLRLNDEHHVLLFCMHHIISDGWSVEVLLTELGQLWQAFEHGEPDPLPELPVQYSDFSCWQRRWLQGETLNEQLAYWKEQLANAPALLQLPTDRPRPPKQSFRGASYTFDIPAAAVSALKTMAQQQQATLFMAMLSAYSILLSRYAQQDDICIGFPIAGRNLPELEPLIGLFVNNLVIRADLSSNPDSTTLIERVRQATLGAYDHQDAPFDLIVDALHLERSLSYTPLLQVSFALQGESLNPQIKHLLGRPAELVDIEWVTAKYDLNLTCFDDETGMTATLEYATDLFDRRTIERMAVHFCQIVHSMAKQPHQSVHTLNMLSGEEKQQLLIQWNACRDTLYESFPVHQRFEQRAAQYPDKIAVSCEGQAITYSMLNQRANQLARELRQHGVGCGDFVGLCLDRSIDLLIGLLGILKAGGAYIPLDPHFPADRLGFILEDSQAQVLVTSTAQLDMMANYTGQKVLLDADSTTINARSSDNLCVDVPLNSVIYVLYTSGTTGKPKGCLVSHANVARLFTATDKDFGFTADDVWSLFHSYAFDFTVWEIWGALLYGGELVIVPYLTSRSPDEFYQLLLDRQVTVLNQTPSAFSQLIAVDSRQNDDRQLALRYVVFGGEALDFPALRTWTNRHSLESPKLINMYGITETTVHVTIYQVKQQDVEHGSSIIGRPIDDLHIHILDRNGQLLPIGVPGELHVSGSGVTHGYLHRDDLSAEKFIPNPMLEELPADLQDRHATVYRSGDLGRYQPNGDIEYLGRIDHQVKIRGHRIELGEIEAGLARLPQIREALVRVNGEGEAKRLVAYLLLSGNESDIDIHVIRSDLKVHLPDYMIPAAYIVMSSWPLTPTGKVDTKALPEPDENAFRSHEYVAPRNETEETIVSVWQDILGLEKVGIYDNFFELGGHSLLATQVTSRLQDHFNIDMPLRVLFENPTIAELAVHVLSAELSDIDDDDMEAMLAELMNDDAPDDT